MNVSRIITKRESGKSYVSVGHTSEVVPRTEAELRKGLVSPVGKKQFQAQLLACLMLSFVFFVPFY